MTISRPGAIMGANTCPIASRCNLHPPTDWKNVVVFLMFRSVFLTFWLVLWSVRTIVFPKPCVAVLIGQLLAGWVLRCLLPAIVRPSGGFASHRSPQVFWPESTHEDSERIRGQLSNKARLPHPTLSRLGLLALPSPRLLLSCAYTPTPQPSESESGTARSGGHSRASALPLIVCRISRALVSSRAG